MKVRVQIQHDTLKLDEIVEGKTLEDIVATAKSKTATKLPFALRLGVNAMPPHIFMQEIVRRYNAEVKPNPPVPIPNTAQEFLDTAVKLGFVTVIEP